MIWWSIPFVMFALFIAVVIAADRREHFGARPRKDTGVRDIPLLTRGRK